MSSRVYRCLVVTEQASPGKWLASATVTFDNRAVSAAEGTGVTEGEAAGHAAQHALESAAKKFKLREVH